MVSRKVFIKDSAVFAAGSLLAPAVLFAQPAAGFTHAPLPYAFDALEPFIDRQTMEIHHGKHYSAYVINANNALKAENLVLKSPQNLFSGISKSAAALRNNAGGAWNHEQFWLWMTPEKMEVPGTLQQALSGSFGSMDMFKEVFSKAAMGRFGSGWAWLIKTNDGKLAVTSTPNQDNPLMDVAEMRGIPLLGLDVWEHAYYLKYQNKRADYIAAWWNVVNWKHVAKMI